MECFLGDLSLFPHYCKNYNSFLSFLTTRTVFAETATVQQTRARLACKQFLFLFRYLILKRYFHNYLLYFLQCLLIFVFFTFHFFTTTCCYFFTYSPSFFSALSSRSFTHCILFYFPPPCQAAIHSQSACAGSNSDPTDHARWLSPENLSLKYIYFRFF